MTIIAYIRFNLFPKMCQNMFFNSSLFTMCKASIHPSDARTCWPWTNKEPAISSAKLGLFGISKELQFGVCNHGEPPAGPPAAREEKLFYREEEKVGRAIVNKKFEVWWLFTGWVVTVSHWLSFLLVKKRKSSFSLLGSAINIGHENSPFWPPDSNLMMFPFVNFHIFPFDQDLSLKALLIKSQGFQFQQPFVPWCQEGPFVSVVSHVRGKMHRLEPYWRHIWVRSRGRRKNSQAFFFSKFFLLSRS